MQGKLSAIKNIIWAAGIALCLLAVLVGFIISAFTRYGGEQQSGALELGGSAGGENVQNKKPDGMDAVSGLDGASAYGDGTLKLLPETSDAGQSYVDMLTFLCDSSLIGLRDYGLLSAGTATSQVWGSSAGNIPAASIAECTIRYPGDGSEISAKDAAMIAKPGILVISLGMDSLLEVTKDEYIAAYTSLISSIRQVSPDTTIICCALTSVLSSYTGADNLSPAAVMEANKWIEQVCMDTGAYFADVGTLVRDSSGCLLSEYASSNGKALNSAGINKVLEYLRVHAAN